MNRVDSNEISGELSEKTKDNRKMLKAIEAYGTLVFVSVIWGMAFVAIKALEPVLNPVNLTLLRWYIAGAVFLALLPILGRPKEKINRKDIPRLLLVSFANVVAYHLTLNFSESEISAGLAPLLTSIGPVFIVILSTVFLKEKHEKVVYISIVASIFGAFILLLGALNTGGNSTYSGVLEAIGTAFSYAVFAVFAKPLVIKYGPRSLTIMAGLIGTAMLLPLTSGNFFYQVSNLPITGWLAILYLSLLSTVLGYMIFFTMIGRGAVAKVSVQLYLIPVVGVLGGAILLGEPVTLFIIAGGALMLLSVGLTTIRPKLPWKNLK